jgi:Domain of unknown function (DUF4258)
MELVTRHARARMQQRGIRPEMLEALLDYGREVRAGGGRELVFFDKRARARLAGAGDRLARLAAPLVRGSAVARAKAGAQSACKTYAIVDSDGTVITVGHRTRRIPR